MFSSLSVVDPVDPLFWTCDGNNFFFLPVMTLSFPLNETAEGLTNSGLTQCYVLWSCETVIYPV